MKKLIVISSLFISLSAISFGLEDLEAQCVACFQSSDGSCTTEMVNRDGASGCGCDTGCDCSGTCEYRGEAMLTPDMKIDDLDVTEDGLMIEVDEINQREIFADLNYGGFIGEEKVSDVWFDNKIAFYKVSKNEFLLFPIKQNEFDLLSCDGEILATIRKN